MNLYSESLLQKRAVKYMEQKYGKEAEFSIERGYAEEYVYKFYIKVKEHDDWDIRVYWDFEKKKFTDNYMSWVFRKQVEEEFYPIFEEVYGKCKIFNEPYDFQISDQYNNDTNFEDYLKTVEASILYLFTTADIEKKEADLQKLGELIKKKGWDADITIMYISEKDLINMNRSNYDEFFKGKYFWRTSLMVFKHRETYIGEWREGKSYGRN